MNFVSSLGIEKLDDTLEMLLANPLFIAMGLACFLDNTVPGNVLDRYADRKRKCLK